MQIRFDGQFYRASYITGPTHNFLAIELSAKPGADPVVVDELNSQPAEPRRLNAGDVERWVIEAVDLANRELGSTYRVVRLQFVISDTHSPGIYAHLARSMVQYAHQAIA